ncbi:MAG: site-2 protease family protein [Verrucomicrobia bacterium]|nr:site-2 protease family protein [Verrucomicrobiota bacterium]
MAQQQFRLFRVFGITVFLHWSWFLVAVYELSQRSSQYHSLGWNIAEYLALFGIVLLHEFGHSLACRQVGGSADQIILWPLGGVAFVNPPPRAGAVLWSIAAGPLVNVVLLVLLSAAGPFLHGLALSASALHFLRQLWWINFTLLAFNLLPVYPLDGGQILRALLWFVLGRSRSLYVAATLGIMGTAGLLAFAVAKGFFSFWIGIMAFFLLSQCWRGFQEAKNLTMLAKIPRHDGFACPSCRAQPLQAQAWACPNCRQPFDTFEHGAVCPACGGASPVTGCPECRRAHPFAEWVAR